MSEFWVDQTVRKLGVALDFFGHRRDINSITVREVQGYVGHLQKLPNGHGGTLSGGKSEALPERAVEALRPGHL